MSRIAARMARKNSQGSIVLKPLTASVTVQDPGVSQHSKSNPAEFAALLQTALEHGRCWMLVFATLLLATSGALAQATNFGLQPVQVASTAQLVTVTAQAAGTIQTVNVLTTGAKNLDFAAGSGAGTCVAGKLLAVGGTCTVSVTFDPTVPGPRLGAVVLEDGSNNVLANAYLSGTGKGGLGVLAKGNFIVVAGDGGYKDGVHDNFPATSSELYLPASVAFDGLGNMYIADTLNERVRLVCSSPTSTTLQGTACTAGNITTVAGSGPSETGSYNGDNIPATSATLASPTGVSFDGAGNLYIADSGNNRIREVNAATGIITTVVGNGTPGSLGNNVAATSAELSNPQGITVDRNGNLFIADTYNNIVREVNAATGMITTVAGVAWTGAAGTGEGYSGDGGPATSALLDNPNAVAFDLAGNMYIPDTLNNVIRKVNTSNIITTFAGNGSVVYPGDTPAVAATAVGLSSPVGVLVDPAGNVYISDTENQAVRKVSAATGLISTAAQFNEDVIGTLSQGFTMTATSLDKPNGLSQDGNGNIFVADTFFNMIREIQGNVAGLDFTGQGAVRQGSQSTKPIDQLVENDGTDTLTLTGVNFISPPANAVLVTPAAAYTACATALSLNVDAQCDLSFKFAPLAPPTVPTLGANTSESSMLQVTDQTEAAVAGSNSPLSVDIVGTASPSNSTSVSLVSSSPATPPGQTVQYQSTFGNSVTFTATVSTNQGTGNLTGTVSFFDGTTALGPVVAVGTSTASGQNTVAVATFTTTTLAIGQHTITAVYNIANDPLHLSGTSNAIQQTVIPVVETTKTVLVASPASPSPIAASVTFTATVSTTGTTPTDNSGIVTFYDGTVILGTAPAGVGGIATLATTPAQLQQGVNSITAVYTPSTANSTLISPSTSAVLSQDVIAPTITVVTSSGTPTNYGDPVTFTVVVTPTGGTAVPTGQVTLLDGSNNLQTITLNPKGAGQYTTTTLHVGSHNMTATYAGDPNCQASPVSATLVQVVNSVALAVSWGPLAPITYGTPLSTSAQLNASASVEGTQISIPGSFAYTPNSGTILGAGPHTLSVVFTPSDTTDFSPITQTAQLTVNPAPLTLTLGPLPAVVYGDPITFSANLSGVPIATGVQGPAGTVTFNNGGSPITTAPIVGSAATTTYNTPPLPVTANAGGDSITATWTDASGNYTALPSASVGLVIKPVPTSIYLSATTPTAGDPAILLVAVVVGTDGPPGLIPGGTVTFTSGAISSGPQPVNASGVATWPPSLPGGAAFTATFTAVYSPTDGIHAPSAQSNQVGVNVSGTAPNFSLSLAIPAPTIKAGGYQTQTVTLSSLNGYSDKGISLGCSGMPIGVTCMFTPASLALAASGQATAQLDIDTGSPLTGGQKSMNAQPRTGSTSLAGLFLPIGAFFGLVLWRFRKRHAVFTSVLLLLLSGAVMLATSCGGLSNSTIATGTYTFYVTASGSNNVDQTVPVTLTVN